MDGLDGNGAYVAGDGTLRIPCYADGCGRLTHGYIGYSLAEALAGGCPDMARATA